MPTKQPSFEDAMHAAALWCNSWEDGQLSDEVLADRVEDLLANRDGVRGFLVISLASDCKLMDRLPEPLVLKLRLAGEIVVDLTVRNLAMSTAMLLHHQRNNDTEMQVGSERVMERCLELLRLLEPNLVKIRLEILLDGLKGDGPDASFLEKWDYDKEQKIAISKSINAVAYLN